MQIIRTEDYTLIQSLAKDIWQDHYVPMIGQMQVDYMLARFYSSSALAQQASEGQDFWLIMHEDKAQGYVGISPKGEDEYFWNKFYIASALQGKGIGEQVFRLVLAQYPDWKTFRLQVNINNYKTINFYFKMGFKIENRFILDIGDGYVMDDFLMVLASKG